MLPVSSTVLLILVQLFAMSNSQEMETITGTIFCDNDFNFYVNGELVAQDPITTFPHNAVNVSFSIPRGKDAIFAIEAMDWADDVSGLEYDNRCVGDGGLRAMFSNGVVTNSSWVCINHHYGPVNWKECVAGQTVRDQSLQLLPACKQNSTAHLNSQQDPKDGQQSDLMTPGGIMQWNSVMLKWDGGYSPLAAKLVQSLLERLTTMETRLPAFRI